MAHMLKQHYLIISKLVQGGMGAVYKAEDTYLGNRLVAIKEMSQRGLDPQEIISSSQAFKQEAHMLAGLHHPNLPSIHEHFEEAGRWYLVMSFIEGETLEDYLQSRGGKLQVAEVLEIGIQLCTVLDYLHNRQPSIIFRDLKPLNIMRVSDGHLYLIDFGIARHFKVGQTSDTRIGYTPGYAAPEQYGLTQTTPRSDIYSLGATLHQLLSGNHPSRTPFLFAPLRLQGYQNASDLEILISKMVEMDESRRPASMKTVKQELQRIATQGIGQYSHPLPSRGSKPLASSPQPTPAVVQKPANAQKPASRNYDTPKPHSPPLITPKPAGTPFTAPVVSVKRGVSRRKVIVGLAGIGLTAVAGGITWWVTTPHPLYAYHGHSDIVNSVAWSPDGRRIASGSQDKTVQVWGALDGGHLYIYRGHSYLVDTVAWSPDGKRIASGGDDTGTVQVWDATDGGHAYIYRGHYTAVKGGAGVTSVAWSPDGTRIASSSDSTSSDIKGTVQTWDAGGGGSISIYHGDMDSVNALAWSPDGKYIAAGGYAQDKPAIVQVWNAIDESHLYTYRGHSSGILDVAWSPNGKQIASAGGSDGTVQVWNAIDGSQVYTYHHSGIFPIFVRTAKWSPGGKLIASAGDDRTVQVWMPE